MSPKNKPGKHIRKSIKKRGHKTSKVGFSRERGCQNHKIGPAWKWTKKGGQKSSKIGPKTIKKCVWTAPKKVFTKRVQNYQKIGSWGGPKGLQNRSKSDKKQGLILGWDPWRALEAKMSARGSILMLFLTNFEGFLDNVFVCIGVLVVDVDVFFVFVLVVYYTILVSFFFV